ncbi:MAG: hypothetical protein COZ87_01835 [Candidatus Moranbacteria bacterium CG_4_8_14_3_um_filter_43_15]|nr:MAG: hypothetical protein COW51_03960 [Candidatus Moranbacteria bacterium CG17_big_fil_post_rev_8_21_14_2_50_44_12]PIW93352.1 MAG: hypothetical protein COZ87_01835 [Candidatus Moranbacteria bacterium CG_4_8_14_3_um_filter_43_15]
MKRSLGNKISWLWQNAEKILIVVFLATFTLNIRKIFLTPYSYLNGEFNEYTTLSFSWADLLMLAVILIYTIKWLLGQGETAEVGEIQGSNGSIKQYNNNSNKSSTLRFPRNVSRLFEAINKHLCQVFKYETFLLVLFLVWALLSISWSVYKPIAIYRIANLLVIVAFVSILAVNLKDKKLLKVAFFALLLNGVLQSALGIAQFVNNSSIGLHFLGESIVSQNLPGVAKILGFGERHIRAYGTFPHPNILAGFLIIPIFIIVSELLKRIVEKTSTSKKVARGTILAGIPAGFLAIALCFILACFILTFSRSALLGLGIGLLALFWLNFDSIISVLTPPRSKRRFLFALLMVFIILSLVVFWFPARKDLLSLKSLDERNPYLNVARGTILEHPIVGVGIGQFVFNEFLKYSNLEGWQYQPVHNVYFLVASELGAIGLILLLLFILFTIQKGIAKSNLTAGSFYCIIISFLVIALFDHYFWDIKIGMITFALAIVFLRLFKVEPAEKN